MEKGARGSAPHQRALGGPGEGGHRQGPLEGDDFLHFAELLEVHHLSGGGGNNSSRGSTLFRDLDGKWVFVR